MKDRPIRRIMADSTARRKAEAEAAGKAVSFVCPKCGRAIASEAKDWEARVVVSDHDGLLQYGHLKCYDEEEA